ncbi:MAG: PD40 domain-containing protein [Deltaproteobacteria bacterium]|nr:PD40 domain-containing protein [Deltaproteobacteria bacterium]
MKESLLLLLFSIAHPIGVWAQDSNLFASGVKVLATLESSVYDWSPDGQRLAYATDDGIWMVEAPDFRHSKRLIRKGRGEEHAIEQLRWSPDGQHLAFVSSRPGDNWSTIWLTDADGSHLRDLLHPGIGPGSPGVRNIRISTWLNNREVAFVSGCGTECTALAKINVKDSSVTGIRTGNVDGEYVWTRTKSHAAIRTHLGGICVVDTLRPAPTAAVCSAEGCWACLEGCATREPPWQGDEYSVTDWAPAGKSVLYMSGSSCEEHSSEEDSSPKYRINLLLWKVDSGRQELLVPNAGWGAWSPDGSKIAFVLFGEPRYDDARRIIETDFVAGQPFRLYLGSLEAATRAVLALAPLGSSLLTPSWLEEVLVNQNFPLPIWSPDSKQIVMEYSHSGLFFIRADGKGLRPLAQGIQLKATWSPDSKWLALQHLGKSVPFKQDPGLERFLPPVGKEDAALSDAEIIQRYFQQSLAKSSDRYPWFLSEYAQALEEIGKVEAAEEQYREGIKRLRSEEQWQEMGMKDFLNGAYTAFLCRQGREQEAAELSGGSPCPPAVPFGNAGEGKWRPWDAVQSRVSSEEKQEAEKQDSRQRPLTETSSDLQQSPSLYIVEAPEKASERESR